MPTDVISEVATGAHDDILERLIEVAHQRIKIKAMAKGLTIQRGDTVRVTGKLKPNYLFGHTFEVVKVNPKSVGVKVPDEEIYGRFRGAQSLNIPLTTVTKV